MKNELFELIEKGTSPFHVVLNAKERLEKAGFMELKPEEKWNLEKDQGYYVDVYGSTLLAFRANQKFQSGDAMRIAAAHTDFPCLRIKGNPDVMAENYHQINIEVYGGAILNTWLDRPLSIAGRVALRSEDIFSPKTVLIDIKRPVLSIPNLAIHMDRTINQGKELNKQKDLLPIMGNGKEDFTSILAKELHVKKEDILDYELTVYNCEKPTYIGLENEFISSPRLDDLTSVDACLNGMIHGKREEGLDVIALFDHEEIGSRSKKGAASMVFPILLQKAYTAYGATKEEYTDAMLKSFCLSVDVAHGIHPNHMDKSDITNKVHLNEGFAIKTASSQSYASDCEMTAVVRGLCEKYEIPYQMFYNRSDMVGGSTLGAIANTMVPMRIQDIGVPLLGMHSAREMMGSRDQDALVRFVEHYFSV